MTTTYKDPSRFDPPSDWVNAHSLYLCRSRMNLNPSQVEALAGIEEETLVNWEKSIEVPTLEDLEKLAKHYRCPVGYFFLEQPPELLINKVNFRGLSENKIDSLSYESRLKIDEFIYLSDTLSSIVNDLRITNNPDVTRIHLNENIKDIVRQERELFSFSDAIRKDWESPGEAFDFWKQAIEKRGVYVISLGLIVNEVRGASRWEDGSPPTILVNKNDYESATGRTFTLLHEWAHLMLREPGIICDFIGSQKEAKVERFANEFAAEMMVGKDELREFLGGKHMDRYKSRWGDSDIDMMKNYFKVSRDVVAISLETMGFAPPGFYKTKRAQWDRRRPYFSGLTPPRILGRTKVKRRYGELGGPYSRLLTEAYISSNISMTSLSRVLGMKIERVNDFINYVKTN